MGGSGGGGQTTTQSTPKVPPWLLPLELTGATSLESALLGGQIPSLTGLYSGVPQLGVPPVTGGQQQDINKLQEGQVILTPQQKQAAGLMQQIASPEAEQKYYEQFAAPEIMQQSALMGQGTSGAADYSLAQGAIPYAMQAKQTELGAATDLAQIGQQGFAQVAEALQAQGIPRDVAMQMAQSIYNQAQQKWQYAQGLQTFPFSLFGPTIGGGTSVQTAPKF